MTAAEAIQAKATARVRRMTMRQLVDAFDALLGTYKPDTVHVRGWLMDEMERRNPAAFERWVVSDDDSPRGYML